MSQNFKVKNGLDINGVQVIAANGQLTGPAATQITNIVSNSSDTWVRTAANSSSSYANSAYSKANTGTTLAQASFDAANTVSSNLSSANTWLQSYVGTQISNLVDSAPTTLDTLNELSAALGDDANFSTTITTMVGVSGGYANSAYTAANTADQRAVTSGSYANSAYTAANTADQRAVTSGSYANSAYTAANTADQRAVTSGSYANSAYTQANTATTNAATADQRAVTSGSYANSAYTLANTKFDTAGGTITGNVSIGTAPSPKNLTVIGTLYGNPATSLLTVADGISSTKVGIGIIGSALYAPTAGIYVGNTSYMAATQFTGDVTVTGNLTISGTTTYANTTTVALGDNIIVLNADLGQSAFPTEAAGIEVERGVKTNSFFTWVESAEKWSAFNGNTAFYIGAESDGSYANSAYAAANVAISNGAVVGGIASAAYTHANSAFVTANGAVTAGLSTYNYANSAFAVANNALQAGNAAISGNLATYAHAAAAFGKANTVETAVITAGNAAGAAGSYANSAFAKANTIPTGISNVAYNSFGVGTAASGTTGEIRATNNITAYYSSDRTLKENIKDVENPLAIVSAIGSKTFDWTDEYIAARGGEDGYFVQKSDFGVVAQDVEKVFPQAVRRRADGTLAVDYEKLATLSFGAINQLLKRIEALEAK